MFRVLLADDEELALVTLQYAFPWREYGFCVQEAVTDSREALGILKRKRIDAAFVDIRMPGLSGLALAKQAREEGIDTVFVIVSGYPDFDYAKEAIGIGVLDYCLKPVSEEEAPQLLKKLRSRILMLRYRKDPAFCLRLLAEEACCESFLSQILPGEGKGEPALLQICTDRLWELLAQADLLSPDEVFFWGEQEALLIWGKCPDNGRLEEFLETYQSDALLIFDTARPDPASFQNSLKRIRMERESSEKGKTGLVRFSPISRELKDCFQELLSYVEEHFDQGLTLKDLAGHFGIHYSYLSQQFGRATGKSFPEYVKCLRLQAACRLLAETQLKVGDIAEKIGYEDCHYFNNIFKRQYDMTPLQYRKAVREAGGSRKEFPAQEAAGVRRKEQET